MWRTSVAAFDCAKLAVNCINPIFWHYIIMTSETSGKEHTFDARGKVSKFAGNEAAYINKVLEADTWSSTYCSGQSWVRSLEIAFAEKWGMKYAIAMNSGTSTLHACLVAAGVKAGDEVISPALTVIMNTTTTLHANAIPVFADIREDTWTIDPQDIRKKITQKTKAIIVVTVYGLPVDYDEIMEIANEHGLSVIEDNAECFLSMYKGRLTGTIGHFSSYSFENSKHLSCGEGGLVLTNDEAGATLVRKTGGHGFMSLGAAEARVVQTAGLDVSDPDFKRHDILGWNYRMPEFCAAVALAQLEKIDLLVDLRVKAALQYDLVLEETNCSFLRRQHVPDGWTHSYWCWSVLYVSENANGVSHKEFRQMLREAGGSTVRAAWSVPYLEPLMSTGAFKERFPAIYDDLTYSKGLCPVAEKIQRGILQFKTSMRSDAEIKVETDALRRAIQLVKRFAE